MGNIRFLQIDSFFWIAWLIYWVLKSQTVNKTASSEPFMQRLLHLLALVLGFILIFSPATVLLPRHDFGGGVETEILGTILCGLGLLFSVYGRNHLGNYWSGTITLKEGHKLIRSGPYQFVRHPLYTGFLGGVLGSAITVHSIEAVVGFIVVLIAYAIKIQREELFLVQLFGEEYLRFKRDVKALVPFIY